METKPIAFPEVNGVLKGPKGVEDLPVYRDGERIVSCWKIPWRKRWRVLLTGLVYLVVRGNSHPPLWIDTEAFERKSDGHPDADRDR